MSSKWEMGGNESGGCGAGGTHPSERIGRRGSIKGGDGRLYAKHQQKDGDRMSLPPNSSWITALGEQRSCRWSSGNEKETQKPPSPRGVEGKRGGKRGGSPSPGKKKLAVRELLTEGRSHESYGWVQESEGRCWLLKGP